MSVNVGDFQWSPSKEQAALLVAEDSKSNPDIAAAVGVTARQLERWKRLDAFRSRVEEHRKLWRDELAAEGLASQKNRLAAYNDRWRRMQRVIEAREADPALANAPGGNTGLMVRQQKGIGSGFNFEIIEEFAVDTGLLKEMRELEKQAAQDLGQWTEKKEIAGKDGGPIAIIEVNAPGSDGSREPPAEVELPPRAVESLAE